MIQWLHLISKQTWIHDNFDEYSIASHQKSIIGTRFNDNWTWITLILYVETTCSWICCHLDHYLLYLFQNIMLNIYIKVTVPILGASINHILNIFQHTNNFALKKSKQSKCGLYFSTWRPTWIPAICARNLWSRVCWVGISVRWWSDAIKYQV